MQQQVNKQEKSDGREALKIKIEKVKSRKHSEESTCIKSKEIACSRER
jgi:hypothetical protein